MPKPTLSLQTSFKGNQGFVNSLFSLMNTLIDSPDYSRFSRRAASLSIKLARIKKDKGAPTDIVIDSTGLRLYGKGEWHSEKYGKCKRKKWKKLHICIDPLDKETVSFTLTESNV